MRWCPDPKHSYDGYDGHPRLEQETFSTKREATAYVRDHYGYIATHKSFRRYPHGWRMPKVLRATLTLEVQDSDRHKR